MIEVTKLTDAATLPYNPAKPAINITKNVVGTAKVAEVTFRLHVCEHLFVHTAEAALSEGTEGVQLFEGAEDGIWMLSARRGEEGSKASEGAEEFVFKCPRLGLSWLLLWLLRRPWMIRLWSRWSGAFLSRSGLVQITLSLRQ